MSWLTANNDRGAYPQTVYSANAKPAPPFPPLKGDADCDFCVVGGGITGLSAALHAAKAGYSVILIEANRIGWGASGRNGGQIGTGLNWDQRKLERTLGNETARAVWSLCQEASSLTRSLIGRYAPEADYVSGLVNVSLTDDEAKEAREYATYLAYSYGAQSTSLDREPLSDLIGTDAYVGGVLDEGSGFCNPLVYTLGLGRACAQAGVTIHEVTEALTIGDARVTTAAGTITAKHILHATNGYGAHLTSGVANRALPINNYIAATEPLGEAAPMKRPLAVTDSRFVVNYFHQTSDGTLVYGGGESYRKRFPRDIEGKVRANLGRVYPRHQSVPLPYHWGGTLAVTATRLPYLAEVSPNVFAAGGYSGHGLALSALFGKLVVEAMDGRRDRFDKIAELPVPSLPGGRWLGGLATTAAMALAAMRDRLQYR